MGVAHGLSGPLSAGHSHRRTSGGVAENLAASPAFEAMRARTLPVAIASGSYTQHVNAFDELQKHLFATASRSVTDLRSKFD
jgi:hypothetical protein